MAPRPNEEYCGKFIEVGTFGFFPLNCDSYDYVETAKSPVKLFERESIRQTRPIYVLLASSFGYLLAPIFAILPLQNFAAQDELLTDSFYWGFMLLNFTILVISLLLFDRIVDILTGGKFPQFAKYLLAVVLVSNVVIKTSVWSAHQQMLTILSPLLCIYFCLRIVLAEEPPPRKIYLISLIGGLLLLTYGNFLILFASVIVAISIQLYRSENFSRRTFKKFLIPSFVLFTFPTLLWSAILLVVNGRVYSHEVSAYRQFVWIFDKLLISFKDFYDQLISFTALYWTSIYRTVLVFIVALILLKIYNSIFQPKKDPAEISPNQFLMQSMLAIIFMLYLSFFWLMGYYGERLTFTLVPVVLCLIALELNEVISRGTALTVKAVYVLLLFCAFFWVYSNVNTYGPFKDLSKTNNFQYLRA
ncbi:MAG: hypothetical protein ABJA66_00640 [Actinomycetota bacterium]